jgi:hypothetical protein
MVIGLVLVNGEGNYLFSALLALLVCEFICAGEEMIDQENVDLVSFSFLDIDKRTLSKCSSNCESNR